MPVPRPPFRMPPEDRDLSPYTGWTRTHWESAADGLLAAVRPCASPGQGLIRLPGPRPSGSGERSDGHEGYARTFLLAALRVAGAGGADPDGLLERYAAGLDAGTRSPTTDPALTGHDPESWPVITDRGQAMVEAASVALALRLTRPWLWDHLSEPVRERAARWLAEGLRRTPHDNNWWLFPLTIGGFLAGAGYVTADAQAAVERGLERIERWHLGGGWYTDGRPRAIDHYNGWALHLYPVLHAHLAGDPALPGTYGPRLSAYLEGYARTFGGDGVPVHQGRSLVYRFAAAAPLWAGALTGHTPLAPGATRRLASGALRHFLDRGAAGEDGRLSLGWYGPYRPVIQSYSGPASPYWASKGFLGLLLPPDHPVWTAREEPGPAETADGVHPLPEAGWLVQSTRSDGLVRLHNHGSDGQPAEEVLPDDPHYARHAHSTATGPGPADGTPDNHFALVVDGEVSERGRIGPLGAGEGWAASTHRPRVGSSELSGVAVTGLVLARGADEVHAHLVVGAGPGTGVLRTGWAVAGTAVRSGVDAAEAWVRAEDGLGCLLRGLHGLGAARTVRLPGGTAFGAAASVPALSGTTAGRPGGDLFVCASRLTAPPAAAAITAAAPAQDGPRTFVQLTAEGARLTVHWPDGTRHEARLCASGVTVGT